MKEILSFYNKQKSGVDVYYVKDPKTGKNVMFSTEVIPREMGKVFPIDYETQKEMLIINADGDLTEDEKLKRIINLLKTKLWKQS